MPWKRPISQPHNLAKGWVGFNFEAAFKCPVKVINDAAMQTLGSYKGGRMLSLGLGTGLGTTFIEDGVVEPMGLGHLPYKKAAAASARRCAPTRSGVSAPV
jgi:polyphosphate glucokinase